jgi:hypothetical protein
MRRSSTRTEGLWSSLKVVELANLTGPTLVEVIQQAHRGVERCAGRRSWPPHSSAIPACRSHDPSPTPKALSNGREHQQHRTDPDEHPAEGDWCGSCRTSCRRVDCAVAPSCQGGTRLPSRQCREPGWRDAPVLPIGSRSSRRSPDNLVGRAPTAGRVGRPAQYRHRPDAGIAEQEDQRAGGIGTTASVSGRITARKATQHPTVTSHSNQASAIPVRACSFTIWSSPPSGWAWAMLAAQRYAIVTARGADSTYHKAPLTQHPGPG